MNNVQGPNRRNFFPNSTTGKTEQSNKAAQMQKMISKRNDASRKKELDNLGQANAKITIDNKIKDFARIKKAVDAAPPVDNSDKIASLREQIKAGQYKVDYDALADKMLANEF